MNERMQAAVASDRAELLAIVEDRFGIPPHLFDAFRLVRVSKKYVSLLPFDHLLPDGLAVTASGVPLLRTNLRHPKLTTAGAQLFGAFATKNVVELNTEQSGRYVRRQDLALDADRIAGCTPGYVLVCWESLPLGLGLLLECEAGNHRMKSLYPGRWSPSG